MAKQYNLSLGAVFLIKEVAGAPGWATTINDIYTAGKVVSEVLPEITPIKDKAELDNPGPVFELNEKQFDCVKKALKYSIEKGYLLPNKYSVQVLEAFRLTE